MENSVFQSYIHNFEQFLYAIGYFGDFIELILVSLLLFNKTDIFVVFIIGYIVNVLLNTTLKKWIHQKRPSNPIKFLINEHVSSYGMPSNHSQSIFYCITFLLLSRNKLDVWTLVSLLICLLALYERWHFRNHTIEQLMVGMVIGIVIGNIFYYGHKFVVK